MLYVPSGSEGEPEGYPAVDGQCRMGVPNLLAGDFNQALMASVALERLGPPSVAVHLRRVDLTVLSNRPPPGACKS